MCFKYISTRSYIVYIKSLMNVTPFVQLSLTLNGTSESKGSLHFGLFRGAHSVLQRISSADDEPYTRDYLICKS